MKKSLFLFLLLPLTLPSLAQNSREQDPYLTKSLANEGIKNVKSATSGGNITVDGVSPSEARVEVYISTNNNNDSPTKEELKTRLEEMYDLNVSVANNTLTATAKPKKNITNWKRALNISFRIYVPQSASGNLSTSGGNIKLSNLSGTQSFSTSGGNLMLDKLSGKLDGKTSGGNIHLSNSKDDIQLTTSGGNISANNCSGNLKLSTSGGSLDLSALSGNIKAGTSGGNVTGKDVAGELIAHTSGGNVHLSNLSCSLETSTSGGNIDVEMTQLGKYVKINNSAGNINISVPKSIGLDLDLSGRIAETHFENFTGKIDEHSVRGKLNGGGIPVSADAGNGRIRIELK